MHVWAVGLGASDGALSFVSAFPTRTRARGMIKGSENGKKTQHRCCESQLTVLLKLLLPLYFFCG